MTAMPVDPVPTADALLPSLLGHFAATTGVSDPFAYAGAVLVFLMLPGPGTFAILTASARGGLRGGFAALGGVMGGDALLMAAAIAGVAALLLANPLAFTVVRWAGIGYLGWIALQLLRARGAAAAMPLPMLPGHFARQAFLITLLNPKAVFFYFAFFPVFIDPARHRGAITFATLALITSLLTAAYGSLLVVAGNAAARRLSGRPLVARWTSRLAGAAIAAFALRMALD